MVEEQRASILPLLFFLVLTFLVAFAGTALALRLFGDSKEAVAIPQVITVEVLITATPQATKSAVATASSGHESGAPAAINPNSLGARDAAISTQTVQIAGGPELRSSCKFYEVREGDSAYFIALRNSVELEDLLRYNNLTQETAIGLQVGQELLIPHAGCRIDWETGELVDVPPTAVPSPTTVPTSTPVAANFAIAEVEGLGDITAEGIRLQNMGDDINVSGWTLSDADGNSYTFRNLLLFAQRSFVLYTRSGTSTANARFWGREQSVWQPGEELTLSDTQGRVLQRLQLPEGEAGG